jgi:hypothetical protein
MSWKISTQRAGLSQTSLVNSQMRQSGVSAAQLVSGAAGIITSTRDVDIRGGLQRAQATARDLVHEMQDLTGADTEIEGRFACK